MSGDRTCCQSTSQSSHLKHGGGHGLFRILLLVLCFVVPAARADTLYRSFDDARDIAAINIDSPDRPVPPTMLIDGVAGRALAVTTGQPTWTFELDREPISGADDLIPSAEPDDDWLLDLHVLARGIPVEPTRILTIGTPSRVNAPFAIIAIEPTGAWSVTLSDGSATLVYEATVPRQFIADAQWHRVRVHVDQTTHLARLYWHEHCVAMYDLSTLGALPDIESVTVGDRAMQGAWYFAIDELRIECGQRIAPPAAGAVAASRAVPNELIDDVRVLSWNLWHGGREDGPDIGVLRVIEIIQEIDPDIICLQETFGSGARIADALGFVLYRCDESLTILSRCPIVHVSRSARPALYAVATIALDDHRAVQVVNVSLHHLPDYWTTPLPDGATANALFAGELPTRVVDIATILQDLAPTLAVADDIPIIVAGGFNSASHLDWTEAQRASHDDLVVHWPVSRMMSARGFTDVFRSLWPDAGTMPGRT
ncbi:MAG: endonuclease/exonuclease/phosphatase family protein, partial [Phycisphaerales bacterium]|nr:endonuclease/exonuclease/phosphatase family protein [Phycisphaerales bacterium]